MRRRLRRWPGPDRAPCWLQPRRALAPVIRCEEWQIEHRTRSKANVTAIRPSVCQHAARWNVAPGVTLRRVARLRVVAFLWLSACTTVPGSDDLDSPSSATEHAYGDQTVVPLDGERAWTGDVEPDDGLWSHTDPGDVPELLDATGVPLPLIHTDVDADLRGHIASVSVTQTFRNDAEDPIEVVYVFPLPENSAVSHMRMVVGDRVVESEILRKGEARQTYETAKSAGYTAALLEQERPNVFTQSVANIAPGEDIDVQIDYVQTLSYDAGTYELVFPMVIGPRYHGDEPVADAHRVSPPVVGKGTRRGDDFEISVTAKTGFAIESFTVPTHDVDAQVDGDVLQLELEQAETLPNRDFVLRYGAAGHKPRATMFLGPTGEDGAGHFALVVHPPRLDVDALVGRREFFFVVDRSGSMGGVPLALAKEAVVEALAHLRPVDTFQIIGFESGTQRLFDKPRPANATNLVEGLAYLDAMYAGGGTEMSGAIEAALSDDVEQGRHRYVMFLTDGFISFEDEIIGAATKFVDRIGKRGQHARVFGVGIGSAPNDHLIQGLSRAGRGAALRVTSREDPADAVMTFARWVDHPIVSSVEVDPGSLSLSGQHPERLGDLFASHATVGFGEYSGDASVPPTVAGLVDGKRVEIPLAIVPASEGADVLDTLWARSAVADLQMEYWSNPRPELVEQITDLGLEHHIVTQYTSLVAVDRERVVGNGQPRMVVEPTLTPRDFTNVVESSPTASFDAGGISLAGTTGAESKYMVDGLRVNAPQITSVPMGTTGRQIMTEANRVEGVRLGDPPPTRALMNIGRIEASSRTQARKARKSLRTAKPGVRRCYLHSEDFERGSRHELSLVLTWSADGKVSVSLSTESDLSEDLLSCVEGQLSTVSWPGLPSGATVTVTLRLIGD